MFPGAHTENLPPVSEETLDLDFGGDLGTVEIMGALEMYFAM